MLDLEIIAHPRYQMILEGAFNYLMQEIGRDKLVDVGAGEVIRKRLKGVFKEFYYNTSS